MKTPNTEPPRDPNNRLNRIASVAFEIDKQITEAYGEKAEVMAVVIIADVAASDGKGGIVNPIVYCSNELRRWVQHALIAEAVDIATANNVNREAEAEALVANNEDDDEEDDDDDDD